jgi:hypothetical protein
MKFAELLAGNKFDVKLDPKAPLKDPRSFNMEKPRERLSRRQPGSIPSLRC